MLLVKDFIKSAQAGDTVYLHNIRQNFDKHGLPMLLALDYSGGRKVFNLGIPTPTNDDEKAFITEYFYVRVYNILSVLGGTSMQVYTGGGEFQAQLALKLDDVFMVNKPKKERQGFAKCLNVADRMNTALGDAPFAFKIIRGEIPALKSTEAKPAEKDVTIAFKNAVKDAEHGHILGLDVGGTDIKIAAAKNGHIHHYKEFDWFPAAFETIEPYIDTIVMIAKLSRAIMSLPDDIGDDTKALVKRLLARQATVDEMYDGLAKLESIAPEIVPLDGIGLSFPDVIAENKIVGGETYKTRGVREHAADYEAEFAKLTPLNELLAKLCKDGAPVHLANDGTVAAYTSAVELAHSDLADTVKLGLFAHTLGTELGSGWIDEFGTAPQIPLEIYNCVIDLGDYPARKFEANDVRSINNFNTQISGTLQKIPAQSGAFRLAEKYYSESSKALYQELFDMGLITRQPDGGMCATIEPKDMRKAFLEHLMKQAEDGVASAARIFEEIGESLAATWLETEYILAPAAKARVLFGRFVKRRSCYDLMYKGAKKILPDIEFMAADEEMALTPLMLELRSNDEFTVAQFGQAIGSIYFAVAK